MAHQIAQGSIYIYMYMYVFIMRILQKCPLVPSLNLLAKTIYLERQAPYFF